METEDGGVDGCASNVKPGGVERGADGAGAERDSQRTLAIEAGTVEAIAAFRRFAEGGSEGEGIVLGHTGAHEEVSEKLRIELALRVVRVLCISRHYEMETWRLRVKYNRIVIDLDSAVDECCTMYSVLRDGSSGMSPLIP